MVFQENFKFEKNKLIYYQTVKSNIRSLFLKEQFSMLEIFDASNHNYQSTVQKVSQIIPAFRLILAEAGIKITHGKVSEVIQKLV